MAALSPLQAVRPAVAPLALAFAWIALAALPEPVAAARGQWTALQELGGEAIHLALIPDPDASYPNRHSRLIWWQRRTIGNVLRWPRPLGEDCASFPTLPALGWNPGEEVFCSGHVPVDGRLHTFGGTDPVGTLDHQIWGIADARSYDPATGLWAARPPMGQARWYPTATVLRDGRVLVAAGNKGEQLWTFGGRRDGSLPPSPAGDLVHRFGRTKGEQSAGYWDPSITPLPDGLQRPVPREGHTAVLLLDPIDPNYLNQVIFGGRDASGVPVENGVWLLRREPAGTLEPDEMYRWTQLLPQGLPPEARSEHSALARSPTEMFVFGGLKRVGGVDVPTSELWRLYRNPDNPSNWLWEQITSPGAPSARWGHAAVHQPTTAQHGERMLVFGGAETPPGAGEVLADHRVWGFDFATSTWGEVVTRTDLFAVTPLPRRDHVMVSDPETGGVLLHGGRLAGGVLSDTLWLLQTETAPNPAEWTKHVTVGLGPGPRAGHSAVYDPGYDVNHRRLIIVGGEQVPGGPPVDNTVYMIEPFNWPRPWFPSRQAPFSMSGHTAALDDYGVMFSRTPEIYDPASDSWTQSPGTGWLQFYYPLHFVVPGNPGGGGRVVAVGEDPQARYLDIPATGPAGTWQTVGSGGSGFSGFRATSGVMYEPGKVLIAGGENLSSSAVVGTSKTLDATSVSNGWVETATPAMAARLRHNLVLLPTGEVLAVGGVTGTLPGSMAAVHCPQLWSPVTRSWTALGDLACDLDGAVPVTRNYHSTALLLPDARVISAGGFDPNPYRTRARIFCPPYLFKPNVTPAEFAPRPVITSAPTHLRWGQVFTICTPNPGAVQHVSLIRPGSTTHSFDENQRHVRLTIQGVASNPPRLFVAAPESRDHAPPGDYLLFLIGSADGTGTYPETPSIAEWVRLQGPAGADLCDQTPPGPVAEFTPDIVGSNEVWFYWTGPGDDGQSVVSGNPTAFDLYGSIDESVPGPAGTPGYGTVGGLTPCTWYNFTVTAWDDNQHQSEPVTAGVQTTCGPGGGGGLSARPVGAMDEGVAAFRAGTAPSSAEELTSQTGRLIVETHAVVEGGWGVTVRRVDGVEGVESPDDEATIVQERDDAGAWRTVARHRVGAAQGPLGISALRDRSRLVFPPNFEIEEIRTRLRSGWRHYDLVSVQHSRLGDLGESLVSASGAAEVATGESLSLAYHATTGPASESAGWYMTVRQGEGNARLPKSLRKGPGAELPLRFALHANQPNPFRGTTLIPFDLPKECHVRLEIFDPLGRRIATVADAIYPAGAHAAEWDLRAGDGSTRPGVYVYRMTAGEFSARGKLSVVP